MRGWAVPGTADRPRDPQISRASLRSSRGRDLRCAGGRALVPIGLPEHMLMQRVCRFAARRVPYVELYHVKLHAPPAAENVAMDEMRVAGY